MQHPGIEGPIELVTTHSIAQDRHPQAIARFQCLVVIDKYAFELRCARSRQDFQRQVTQVAVVALVEDQGHHCAMAGTGIE